MSHAHDHTESTAPRAGAYVVAKLRELELEVAHATPRVAASGDDEEAVHDLRVAIRRMRTLLKMSRALFGRWHTDVVRASFAEVMRATGELRDEEVLEETLEDVTEGPELASWLGERKTLESKLRRAVVSRIEKGELDRARLMLKALLVFPVEPERNVALSRFARRTVERARRRVEKERDAEVTDATAMHDLRIAYKELRYSIELLADALPIDARAQLEPATVFQKRLGEIHDVDVAREVVDGAKALSEGARNQALSALAALRTKRVHKYLREVDPIGAAQRKAEAREVDAARETRDFGDAAGDAAGGADENDASSKTAAGDRGPRGSREDATAQRPPPKAAAPTRRAKAPASPRTARTKNRREGLK